MAGTDDREHDESQHWFEPVARHLGAAYLRYSFTKGTEQEVEFLWGQLGLSAGDAVLDVGCGPGRHSLELARRGARVTGVDISEEFVDLARAAAGEQDLPCDFRVGDAAELAFDAEFDAVVSLCQGGFGVPRHGDDDTSILTRMVAAVRPGGHVALSAFSAYFQVRFLEEGETFDAAAGLHHERVTVKNPEGEEREFDAWTSCWTPRELRFLAAAAGLEDVEVHGVTPGRYSREPPTTECPEFLVVAHRPRA